MQKTFNAKTQRCEDAKVLKAFAGSLARHRLVNTSCRSPRLEFVVSTLRLGLFALFALNSDGIVPV
jgi:hypothetical protein